VKWFSLAAKQNHVEALYNLGFHYANGKGVAVDDAEAARWYRLAATEGHQGAFFQLRLMQSSGRAPALTAEETLRVYRVAAEQGNADAQYEIGRIHADRPVDTPNLAEASK